MANIFNTTTGEVKLCDQMCFQAGLSIEEIESMGLRFQRNYYVGNGWANRAYEPCVVQGKKIYLTLTFFDNHLKKISFGFITEEMDPFLKLAMYRDFLEGELGKPSATENNKLIVSYDYPWGGVGAAYDPRTGGTGMTISWKSE